MSISTRYNPAEFEGKWYQHWLDKRYFNSKPDDREAFSIVIPPPNVTGVLHMGHMLNNTIQDVLCRKARLEGKNVCWVPGTDHASIATEAKVVKLLREKGIKKSDLTREEFLEHAYAWKEEYGGRILEQLKELGASCDWERTRFTMEPRLNKYVTQIFVDLYNKGKLYRGLRMVNWDPQAKTVLSNEEVIHGEENSHLYHIRYDVEGEDGFVVIATQRPETIMADTAVAIHPNDERFRHLVGKKVLIPLINRAIPIIEDEYVTLDFGTGALKVTPAHDQNDYEIGKRHGLEVIDILNDDGTLNEKAMILVGQDRFVARKSIKTLLEEAGHLVELEPYRTNIGRSERTNAVVEPKLSLQWYVDMKKLAKPALEAVLQEDIKFFPKNFVNLYNHWMSEDNIRDWCISRQLWWGQQIPAWYYEDKVFVAETEAEALTQAQQALNNPNLTAADLKRDEDVVDTWFSSWLWPISVFDGFENREELDYYYPTSVLVTGFDIIFFWVARMIMAGYEFEGKRPFKDVYFTGMVRDKQGRKMSKSLGNSPDTKMLMDKFGTDGTRFGVLYKAPAGGDIKFDESMCEEGAKFCNKMWNALRMLKQLEVVETNDNKDALAVNELAFEWFDNRLNQALKDLNHNLGSYRLSESLVSISNLVWNEFCSWFLEMIKPEYGKPIDRTTLNKAIDLFEKQMTLLHPFMPFITEEIWHQMREREDGDDCTNSNWLEEADYDANLLKSVAKAQEVITNIRNQRSKNGLSPKQALEAYVEDAEGAQVLFADARIKAMIMKMANLSSLEITSGDIENGVGFVSGTEKYYLVIEKEIDVEAERKRLEDDLKKAKGFLIGVSKKLSNERFVNSAPADVLARERQKQTDGEARLKIIEESLAKLG
jgi:valyl-tRNA synthetase